MLEQFGGHSFFCMLNPLMAFGCLFIIALLTAVYCYNNFCQIFVNGKIRYVKPMENLRFQSKVTDSKNHIRASTWKLNSTLFGDIKTVRDLTEYVVKKHSSNPCFGRRPNFESAPTWNTYEKMGNTVKAIGSAISQWFDSSHEEQQFIGLYGRNSAEWFSTELACGSYGLVAVPLYDTLGQEALVHILKQTGLRIVLCDTVAQTRKLLTLTQDQLTHIIIVNKDDSEWESLKESTKGSVELVTFDQLVTIGQKNPLPVKNPKMDDTFLVCYTSGSTGLPKGVIHTHRTFVHAVSLAQSAIETLNYDQTIHRHVSYLPLSHIMEQMVISVMLVSGYQVAFLTTDISRLLTDLSYYRPTIFVAVPRILSRMYTDTIRGTGGGAWTTWLFNLAIQKKLNEQKRGIFRQGGLLDYFFFRKIREQLGCCVSLIVCGSAPLQAEVLEFIKAAFSCVVMEGYGSTECGGLVTATLPLDPNAGHAGAIVAGVTVKLVDVPSMNLIVERDGMGETGSLKIVDRSKHIFKLSQGEYIAPEKVEQVYATSPLVTNIYVDGNSTGSYIVAVVVPDLKEVCRRFATHLVSLCSPAPSSAQSADEKNTVTLSQVKAIHLCPEPFSIANGMLTPTMKVSRPAVRRHFSEAIAKLYEQK
ncbi:long-chain acyl-CoA synthetase [Paragonimus westermani]|uniref:long-chain-fatty-acid--CoA ligase n=1 Tax=Paragonimus westermani TaxID=34504 RepID=A0A5J4NGV1_9TREM|nr:long-chain acyl-CoA synthetase [Paragonimus westermani]